jgi:hypothetical protein
VPSSAPSAQRASAEPAQKMATSTEAASRKT